jgi:hypothetical protein
VPDHILFAFEIPCTHIALPKAIIFSVRAHDGDLDALVVFILAFKHAVEIRSQGSVGTIFERGTRSLTYSLGALLEHMTRKTSFPLRIVEVTKLVSRHVHQKEPFSHIKPGEWCPDVCVSISSHLIDFNPFSLCDGQMIFLQRQFFFIRRHILMIEAPSIPISTFFLQIGIGDFFTLLLNLSLLRILNGRILKKADLSSFYDWQAFKHPDRFY